MKMFEFWLKFDWSRHNADHKFRQVFVKVSLDMKDFEDIFDDQAISFKMADEFMQNFTALPVLATHLYGKQSLAYFR